MPAEERNESLFADFINRIEDKISNLVTLDIKTVVGDYRYGYNEEVEPNMEGDFKVMTSRINLVGGDITTQISNNLMDEKYAWLLDFHARKEEKGHEIIKGNIQALLALYKLYTETKSVKLDNDNRDETLREENETRG